MVDDKELEEKDYYRKRLRQWRELGFDTTELEVMLETDFEHFKTFSMDKLREQLHLMSSEEKIPKNKEEPLPRINSRSDKRLERPIITEFDDIRKQNEDEKEDALFDIRKEMARRRKYEDTDVRDIEEDREFEPTSERRRAPKERPKPKEPDIDEDFPLISFKSNKDKAPPVTARSQEKETPVPSPKTQAELELLEEEAALARRKHKLLEEEEERLRRKRHLLMGRTEDDPRAKPDRGEEERLKRRRALELAERESERRQKAVKIEEAQDEDEAALIFVDKGHNGEDGEEDMDEEEPEEEPSEDEHVRLRVAHGSAQEEPEEVSEVEEVAPIRVVKPLKKVQPDPTKKPVTKATSPVKRLPSSVKVSPTLVKSVKGKSVVPPVRKVRPVKPLVRKKEPKKKYPYMVAAILVVLVLVVAAYYGPLKVPTVTVKALASKDHISIGDSVIFSGNGSKSSGPISSYIWDFGDGTVKGKGKVVHHVYLKAGVFNVTLTVKEDSGKSGTAKLVINVAHLQVTPPGKQIGDIAAYTVNGGAILQGDSLYAIKSPAPQLGVPDITVTKIDMTYNGTLTSSVKDLLSTEDGFNETHNTLHREVAETTQFSATATTNIGSATITGTEAMKQQVYIDLKTAQSVKTVLHSDLKTEPIKLPLITMKAMTSKDDLRAYPDLATADSQINLEDLYVGKTFNTGDPNTLQGQFSKGQAPNTVTYYWKYVGIDNIYKRPAIHLNVTIDQNTLSKLSLTSLYIDLWVSADIPTYVQMHTYLEGQNETTQYSAHNLQVMSSFTPGTVPITGTCDAPHYDTLHVLANMGTFNITPPQGSPNGTSIQFTPHAALLIGLNQSSDFRTYMSSGSPYAVSGNYSEKKGPSWNMTFGKEGSTSGYNVIVTDLGGGSYQVMPKAVSITAPSIPRDNIGSLVTLTSAEAIFHADPEVSDEIFVGKSLNFDTTNWLFQASTPYPNLDFTYTSVSATNIQYAYSLVKQDPAKPGTMFSVALNVQDGQLMWVQTHSGTIPLNPIRLP
jgi:PKD repeat protein